MQVVSNTSPIGHPAQSKKRRRNPLTCGSRWIASSRKPAFSFRTASETRSSPKRGSAYENNQLDPALNDLGDRLGVAHPTPALILS